MAATTAANTTSSPPPVKRRRFSLTRVERKNLLLGLLFISPWIIGFVVFLAYPIYYTLQLSFTQYGGFGDPVWIGLDNYSRMFDDNVFRKSLYNTLYYTAFAVPIGVVVAMALALAMNQPVREIPIYRTILFLPSVLPLFAVSFIFMILLDPSQGIINELLRRFGMSPPNWFGDPAYAKLGIVMIAQMGAGQIALIFLAGLRGIPTHLYESAMLDGAGWWSRFRNITIPLMTPIILYDLILGISQGIQVFTQSYIITNGGPANSTNFMVFYMYNNAFRYGGQIGYASAIGVVIFLITFLLAGLIFWTSSKWVNYDLN
jgi:multiple sugar transport system permease protein